MYDDKLKDILLYCTIVHLHTTYNNTTYDVSLRFNGNDAVVIYLKSKWIEINLLCDVTLFLKI